MKNIKRIIFIFFAFFTLLFFLPLIKACVSAELAKSSYLPGETFQAEISGTFAKKLELSNIFFYRNNSELLIPIYVEQLASNKYFVYSELPNTPGNYRFALKNVLCMENNTLKKKEIEQNFTLKKPLSLSYSWLSGQVKTLTWKSLSTEENALALLALSYDSSVVPEGKTALIEKSKNKTKECWPNAPCKVKETALALLALNKVSSQETNASKNWLWNAQNSVSDGLWDLIITSNSVSSCVLKINNQEKNINTISGTNTISLSLPGDATIEIILSCSGSSSLNAKAVNTYLGSVREFPLVQEGSLLKTTLNNKKCWGTEYRSECDAASTAYALWALHELGTENNKAKEWLVQNAQNTEERAIAYYLAKDSSLKSWLTNNQAIDGYWSSKALALSTAPDIKSTALSVFSLSGDENRISTDRAKSWLLKKYSQNDSFGSVLETAYVLHNVFPSGQIEPIISVEPALIKSKSTESFTIRLRNKGSLNVNVLATLDDETKNLSLAKNTAGEIKFLSALADETTLSALDIVYNTAISEEKYGYKVPLMIFPKRIVKIEDEVNKTSMSEEQIIIKPDLRFEDKKINKSVVSGERTSVKIILKNPSKEAISNIDITYSLELFGIIEKIEPYNVEELMPGESKEIEITINGENAFGSYYGTIEAKSEGTSISIPFYVEAVSSSALETGNKTCLEINGISCKQDEKCNGTLSIASDAPKCCIGKCEKEVKTEKKPKTGLIIGIILIIAAIGAAIYFFYSRLKHQKKEQKDILENIEKRYVSRYSTEK